MNPCWQPLPLPMMSALIPQPCCAAWSLCPGSGKQAQADLPRHLARLVAGVPEGRRLPLLLLTLTFEEQQQVETEAYLEEWLRSPFTG